MSDTLNHKPVLFDEALHALRIKPSGIYIDGTFGRGGHSQAILAQLDQAGKLYAFDRDPDAIDHAKGIAQDSRFQIAHRPFSEMAEQASSWGITKQVNGILLDIGVSSPQLDDATRGFSFKADGPLDMRMDPTRGQSAADWLMRAKEEEIAKVIKEYGEEKFFRRISKAIVNARAETPLTHTRQLAEIVAKAHPAWEKGKDPATRTFQAIRIFINGELEELKVALNQALDVLAPNGRLAVISFHSLEDRIVKQFIQKHARGDDFPPDLPVSVDALKPRLKKLGKMITASDAEITENPRARSARLRIAEIY